MYKSILSVLLAGLAAFVLFVVNSIMVFEASGGQKSPNPPTLKPGVDVVFCLDTTGSMSGLIEGAKQKIWSISSRIAEGKPAPNIRIGLVGYRDKGDEYITKIFERE